MLTEYHCHILPGIDDGAADTETSLAMLETMRQQGVERVAATPHFYAHRERSLEHYLEKRQAAFDKIRETAPIREIRLGAEVAIEHGLSEIAGIEKLAIEGTNLILLEFPYRGFKEWMLEEAYNISAEYKLQIVFAHIHRYLEYYSKDEMRHVLDTKAIFQINNEAFGSLMQRSFVKSLMKEGKPLVFGSDAHNMTGRRPNWDLLQKKVKPDVIAASDRVLDTFHL